jgi:hypothetical protein
LARHTRLQHILEQEGFHPLEERSTVVDGWGTIGALGWYDDAFRDEAIGVPEEYCRQTRSPISEHVIWNDARYAAGR